MIPVQVQDEPRGFDERVRKPGQGFLKALGRKPTHKDFRKNWYWNRITPELHQAYRGICAYSANPIPLGSQEASIDHFIPRHSSPELAYEWNNYRLASAKLGNYKGKSLDVIDPFFIKTDWFVLDFPTFQIKPHSSLPAYLLSRIKKTIEILRLNKDNNLVDTRMDVLKGYAKGKYPLSFLEKKYPFIAYELKRQQMEVRIKAILNR